MYDYEAHVCDLIQAAYPLIDVLTEFPDNVYTRATCVVVQQSGGQIVGRYGAKPLFDITVFNHDTRAVTRRLARSILKALQDKASLDVTSLPNSIRTADLPDDYQRWLMTLGVYFNDGLSS